MQHCLNCQSEIDNTKKYCSACGQKTTVSALSISSIVQDFFSNLFNVENKIWRTLRDIWIPAKLSLAYIEGKRVQYYNPIRIFLIVLFTLFTVTLLRINDELQGLNDFTTIQQENIWKENLINRYDSLALKHFFLKDSVHFKAALFSLSYKSDTIRNAEIMNDVFNEVDSILDENGLDNQNIIIPGDSSNENQANNLKINLNSKEDLKLEQNDGMLFPGLPTADLYRLSLEELQLKHGQGNKYYELGLERIQKVFKDFSGSVRFLISNGTWAVIATILFLALVFKLLYIRHNYLYAEHFIFHLYGHTRMLLLMLIISIIGSITGGGIITTILWWIWFLIGPIYLYIGMKRFYSKSKAKMKLKFLFTATLAYPFIISLCIFLITLLSFVFI